MTDLPPGWTTAPLSELVDVLDNQRIPVSAAERAKRPGSVPYYGATGQVGYIDRAIFNESLVLLGEDGVAFHDSAKLKAYAISGPSWVNNHAHVLRSDDKLLDQRYLLHYLNYFDYHDYATGTTRLKLTKSAMTQIPVHLPPLAEQRRIVNALDFYLPRLQSAMTSLRSAFAKVALLVATARHDTTMAFANDTQFLGDLLVEIEAGKSFAAEGRPAEADEWGIIKVSAMTWGEFRQDENKAVPCDREIDIRHEIRPGDILISRANTEKYVGAAVFVRDTRPKLLLSDKSLRLIPKKSVDRTWLAEVLASPGVRSQISERATGMKDSMRNISQKALREIRVPCATLRQQAGAIEALSGLRAETSRLRSQVSAAERRQDLLRASLFRDAFAGRFMLQDQNDEPALVLLERIKAERVAQPKPKVARRNTNPDQERMR